MLAAILPVFLIIVLGVAIRHYQWLPEEFFPSIEKFSYNIAFPALLFAGTARLDFHSAKVGELALATLLPTALATIASVLGLLAARIAVTLARNPIILSTLAGVAFSLSGLALPAPLMNTLDILGRAALCLGLICVGSGLVFSTTGLRPVALGFTSLLKLLAMPLLAAKVCLMFAVSAPVALAACFYCALPTAPNAYIMARQMGGDTRLMAALITLQTALAALTVPLSLGFMEWLA
jgi:predicted permease